MTLPESVLILAPHPDDDIIGAGGLLSVMSRNGKRCKVLYGTTNEPRAKEAVAALNSISNDILVESLYANIDKMLPSISIHDFINHLEQVINEFKPELVLLPNINSYHQDHRMMATCAISALRSRGGTDNYLVPKVATYEEISDSWSLNKISPRNDIYFVLEEQDIVAKCNAMKLHVSQNRDFPSERSTDAMVSLAKVRGSQIGKPYAESYEVNRWII
jgi:LmbE family N-acetylglucosaminyl deacetylase